MNNSPSLANSSGLIVTLIVALIVAAVFVAVIVAAAAGRRKNERRGEMLFQLGYTQVTSPPQQLVARITAMRHGRGDQRLELSQVFKRPISGGEIYVFDLIDAGEETSSLADGAVAIVSPALALPRFALIPRPGNPGAGAGLLWQLAEKALSWAASRTGLETMTFGDTAGFDEAFITLADVPADVRAFLTARLRTELLQMERRYAIDADGDTLMLTQGPGIETADTYSPDRLSRVREDAELLLSRLRVEGIRYV